MDFEKFRNQIYIYAVLDPIIFLLYKRYGYQFSEIPAELGGGRKIYWGEETFPAFLNLEKNVIYIKEKKPKLWEMIQDMEKE